MGRDHSRPGDLDGDKLMNMQAAESKVLLLPTNVTDAGATGAFVDLQGFTNPGSRNMKAILLVGAGTTAGTAGGTVQAADDTSGTNAATVATFTTQTSAGGSEEKHFVTNQRYVRYLGSVQSGKDMNISVAILGEARYRP
jgi:hypothetical protein